MAIQRPQPTIELLPERLALDGGGVLLHHHQKSAPGLAFGVFVHRGTRDESPQDAGIAHLLEHMVFKGSSRRSAFELARDVEALGAQLDAYTTKEYTAYTLRCLPEVFLPAAEILREMLFDSSFPEDQLELEKSVVVDEIKGSEDTPDDHVHELFGAELFGSHPLGRPILGSVDSVRETRRERLAQWLLENYRGANVTLSLAGATDRGMVESVQGLFDFPGPANERKSPAIPRQTGRRDFRHELEHQYVEMGVLCGGAHAPERYAVALLANLLGGGMSSRIFQRVREQEGLAYSVYSYADSFVDVGMFGSSFAATPENAGRALEVIFEEYERLRKGDLDDAELESNRTQLLAGVLLGTEGVGSRMTRMARSEMVYGRYVPTAEIVEAVRAIRRDDVVAVAQRLLDPAEQTVVSYGPGAEMESESQG